MNFGDYFQSLNISQVMHHLKQNSTSCTHVLGVKLVSVLTDMSYATEKI